MKRRLSVTIAVISAWVIGGLFIVPAVVRQGYAGESLGPINSVFGGRDLHPVDFYLDAWWGLFGPATLGLVLLGAAWVTWTAVGERRRDFLHRLVGGKAPMAPASVVRYAVLAGLLGGTAESAYLFARQVATQRPAAHFHMEILWMAPLSGALTLVFVGLVMSGLAHSARGGFGLWKATFLLGFLAVHGVTQSDGIPFHWSAELFLSLGVAAVLARLAVAHANPWRQGVKRSLPLSAAWIVVLLAVGQWTLPQRLEARALSGVPEARSGLPNLLLIILDTARAKNFGLYGYERDTSPTIDEWAGDGVAFEWAIATSSWTLPSHASMFTGEWDSETLTGNSRPLVDEFLTMAEVLSELGYGTGGFAANPGYTSSMSGLAQGFQRYEDRPVNVNAFLWSSWIARTLLAQPLLRVVTRHALRNKGAEVVTDEFLGWLTERQERGDDRPFFAFLNYYDAHSPYVTPPDWHERFGPAPTTSWPEFARNYRPAPEVPLNDAELDRWVNRYDAGIAYIDWHLARIREALEEQGSLENTLVVITSDHGEMWGERDELFHRGSLYLPAVHVPMVLSWPDRLPAGARVRQPVSIRDLPRTFADLAGIDELADFPGASLVPLWSDSTATHPAPIAEVRPYPEEEEDWWAQVNHGPIRSIFIDDYQYIERGDGFRELYDVLSDPNLENNLAEDEDFQDMLTRMSQALASVGR